MHKTNALRGMALCAVCLAACLAAASCAPAAPTEAPRNEEPVLEVDFAWSPDAECGVCHTVQEASLASIPCAAAVAERSDSPCSVCHAEEAGLAQAHEGATPEKASKAKLLDTTIDERACTDCHGAYEQLAEKTADVSVLTDSEGTVVNPHDRPAGEGHAGSTCANCHMLHTGDPAAEAAPAYCLDCHHADVYECNTCHD